MRTILLTLALTATLGAQAAADPFFVEENVIFFDTENSSTTEEIEFGQREHLLQILKKIRGLISLFLIVAAG